MTQTTGYYIPHTANTNIPHSEYKYTYINQAVYSPPSEYTYTRIYNRPTVRLFLSVRNTLMHPVDIDSGILVTRPFRPARPLFSSEALWSTRGIPIVTRPLRPARPLFSSEALWSTRGIPIVTRPLGLPVHSSPARPYRIYARYPYSDAALGPARPLFSSESYGSTRGISSFSPPPTDVPVRI